MHFLQDLTSIPENGNWVCLFKLVRRWWFVVRRLGIGFVLHFLFVSLFLNPDTGPPFGVKVIIAARCACVVFMCLGVILTPPFVFFLLYYTTDFVFVKLFF